MIVERRVDYYCTGYWAEMMAVTKVRKRIGQMTMMSIGFMAG